MPAPKKPAAPKVAAKPAPKRLVRLLIERAGNGYAIRDPEAGYDEPLLAVAVDHDGLLGAVGNWAAPVTPAKKR